MEDVILGVDSFFLGGGISINSVWDYKYSKVVVAFVTFLDQKCNQQPLCMVFIYLFIYFSHALLFLFHSFSLSLPLPLTPLLLFVRRTMAGGPIPASYKVKKNKFVEEWNGRREITEKTFAPSGSEVASIFFYVAVIPYGLYSLMRAEFQAKGDRRYKDCI